MVTIKTALSSSGTILDISPKVSVSPKTCFASPWVRFSVLSSLKPPLTQGSVSKILRLEEIF